MEINLNLELSLQINQKTTMTTTIDINEDISILKKQSTLKIPQHPIQFKTIKRTI